MISSAFHMVIYEPLYNGLVFLVGVMPAHDVGLAVIALTILVRIVLFPLAQRAVRTQKAMREAAPEVEELKKRHKDNKEEQTRAILALYKERGIKPLSSFGLLLVQLPVFIGLYWVFAWGGLPEVDASLLYSFVPAPPAVDMEFLGVFDMAGRSVALALLAGVTQALYSRLSMGPRKKAVSDGTFSGDLARSFDLQARYVFPILVLVIGYTVVAAATLYFVVGNLFMIGQELLAGRRFSESHKS